MKRLYLLLCALWMLPALSRAQTYPISVTVNVLPPYSAFVQDYTAVPGKVVVTVQNTSTQVQQVRLLASFVGDNGVAVRTHAGYNPPVPLTMAPFERRQLSQADLNGLFDAGQVDVEGINKQDLFAGRPMPDGAYQLCLAAYKYQSPQRLSDEYPTGCSPYFQVRSIEPPILIQPMCEANVVATTPQSIIFTWAPPTGIPAGALVRYRLRLIELPPSQADPLVTANNYIDAVVNPVTGLEVDNLITNSYLFNASAPALTVGRRYAWRVQVYDPLGRQSILNEGKSPVCWFTYGGDQGGVPVDNFNFSNNIGGGKPTAPPVLPPGKPLVVVPPKPGLPVPPLTMQPMELVAPVCACKKGPANTDAVTSLTAAQLVGKPITMAGFTFTLSEGYYTVSADGKITGTATVPVPLIGLSLVKIRVKLYGVSVNSNYEVVGGTAQSIISGDVPGITPNLDKPIPPGLALTPATISSIGSTLSSLPGHLWDAAKNSANSAGWEMPLGVDKTFGTVSTRLAIMSVSFTPSDAWFDANTFLTIPGEQFNGIALAAEHVCINPTDFCDGTARLMLVQACNLSLLRLLGRDSIVAGKDPTYAIYDRQKGLSKINISGLLRLPLLENNPGGGMVAAYAHTAQPLVMDSLSNFSLEVLLPDFNIKGLSDYVFSMQGKKAATYDHSLTANPGTLPDTLADEGLAWKGLFIPALTLTAKGPVGSISPAGSITVTATNLAYDNNGFTARISAGSEASPIVGPKDGTLGGWYASLENINLVFYHSGLVRGGLAGRVGLPICKNASGKDGSLRYTGLLTIGSDNSKSVIFNARPDGALKADVLVSTLNLDSTTYIKAGNFGQGSSFLVQANLSGWLDMKVGPIDFTAMNFKQIQLQSQAPYFSMTSVGLNSPQKEIAGMDFTLEGGTKKGEYYELRPGGTGVDFAFTGGLKLKGVLTSHVSVGFGFTTGLAGGRPDWNYDGLHLDSASVDGQLAGCHVDGKVGFYGYDGKGPDPVYGTGLKGGLALHLFDGAGGLGVGLSLSGRFGKMSGANPYKYMCLGGLVRMPDAARVPLGPPVLFMNGFGGGFASNMVQNTTKDGFIPQKGGLSFSATILVQTLDGTVLNGSATITASLKENEDESLEFESLSIGGGATLLSNPINPKEGSAQDWQKAKPTGGIATGSFDLQIDDAGQMLTAEMDAAYQVGGTGFKGHGSLVLSMVNDKAANFWLALGTPQNRNTMSLTILGLNVANTGTYFVTGNNKPADVQVPPTDFYGLPSDLAAKLPTGGKQAGFMGYVSKPGSPVLAFGAAVQIGDKYTLGPFSVDFEATAGADVALIKPETPCQGKTDIGFNGMYALGQAYAGLKASIDIYVDIWFFSGDINIASLQAGAYMRAGLPNPLWAKGGAFVSYSVLGGAASGSATIDINYNLKDKCEPTFIPPNPFADIPLITSVAPAPEKGDKVSILTPFEAQFGYAFRSTISADYTDDKGELHHRSFRLDYLKGKDFNVTANGISLNAANCKITNEGRAEYIKNTAGEARGVRYLRNNALLADMNYTLEVGVEVSEFVSGGWSAYYYKNKPVNQLETVKFMTDHCIDVFSKAGHDEAVSYMVPLEGQRFLTPQDTRNGRIQLKANLSCCTQGIESNEFFTLKVRYVPLEGTVFDRAAGGTKLADAAFAGDLFTYKIPDGLKLNQIYRIDVVRVPTDAFLQKQEEAEKTLKAKSITLANANMYVGGKGIPGMPKLDAGTQQQLGGFKATQVGLGGQIGLGGQAGLGKEPTHYEGQAAVDKYGQALATTQAQYMAANGIASKNYDFKAGTSNLKLMTTGAASALQQKAREKLDYEQLRYSYYVKTSKFGTLTQKITSFKGQSPATFLPLVTYTDYSDKPYSEGVYFYGLEPQEDIEAYELRGYKNDKGASIPPLIWLYTGMGSYAKYWFDYRRAYDQSVGMPADPQYDPGMRFGRLSTYPLPPLAPLTNITTSK